MSAWIHYSHLMSVACVLVLLSAGLCKRVTNLLIHNTWMLTPKAAPKGVFLDFPRHWEYIENRELVQRSNFYLIYTGFLFMQCSIYTGYWFAVGLFRVQFIQVMMLAYWWFVLNNFFCRFIQDSTCTGYFYTQ
jgi:hypothetical protein